MASEIITIEDIKRFHSKSIRDYGEGCLVWQGTLFQNGYGAFKAHGKMMRAHRVAWTIAWGDIPAGKLVLHACDNRPCVEPTHLFLGDHALNMADMVSKGRSATGDRNAARLYPNKWARGEAHPRASLTEEIVRSIRFAYHIGHGPAGIGKHFGISKHRVMLIVNRQAWAHVK